MYSRNNRKELINRQKSKQQRFTIKKLTVGVASVLVGFAFLGTSNSVKADTSQTTSSNNDEATPKNELAGAKLQNSVVNLSSLNTQLKSAPVATSNGISTLSSSTAQSATNSVVSNPQISLAATDTQTPVAQPSTFTGTMWMTAAQRFNTGDTMNVVYKLSATGGTTNGNGHYLNQTNYIFMLPQGFTAEPSDFSYQGVSTDQVQLESAGNKNTFKLTLPFTPTDINPVIVNIKAKLTENMMGNTWWNAFSALGLINSNNAFTTINTNAGTMNFNGTSYNVLQPASKIDAQAFSYSMNEPYQPTNKYQTVYNGYFNGMTAESSTGNIYGTGAGQSSSAKLTYTLVASSGEPNSNYYMGASSYYVYVPIGFTASSDGITTNAHSPAQITYLGKDSSTNQQVYKVTLDYTPSVLAPVTLTMKATVDPKITMPESYTVNSQNSLYAVADGHFTGGTQGTITVNGQAYPVIKSSNTTNSVTYLVAPKLSELPANEFQVTNVKATTYQGNAANNTAGGERLDFTIVFPNHQVKAGQYIDIHLGLPYGNDQFKNYDTHLSNGSTLIKDENGNTVGTLVGIDDYYRIIFTADNNAIANINTDNLDGLRWSSDATNPGLDSFYVYQYTNEKNENNTEFAYKPNNDVTINGRSYASGLTVTGIKKYRGSALDVVTQDSQEALMTNVNRTWYLGDRVKINNIWGNDVVINLNTKQTGTDFKLAVTMAYNSQLTYSFYSAETIQENLQSYGETNDSNDLVTPLSDNKDIYLENNPTKSAVDGQISVSTDDPVIKNGTITKTYNVHIGNPDFNFSSAMNNNFPIVLGYASYNGFTIPEDVTSYEQDLATHFTKGYYTGYGTSNSKLLNILEKTGLKNGTVYTVTVTKDDGSQFELQRLSSDTNKLWNSSISNVTDSNVTIPNSAVNAHTLKMNQIYNPRGTNVWMYQTGIDPISLSTSRLAQAVTKMGSGQVLINKIPIWIRMAITGLTDLPAGTSAQWIGPKEFNTSEVGYTPGVDLSTTTLNDNNAFLKIFYPDGTTDYVSFGYLVIPKPTIRAYEVPLYKQLTDGNLLQLVSNRQDKVGYPVNVRWLTKPDTSKPGTHAGRAIFIYNVGNLEDPQNSMGGFGRLPSPREQIYTFWTINTSEDPNFVAQIIKGSNGNVVEAETKDNQLSKLIQYDTDGNVLDTFTLNRQGTLVNKNNQKLVDNQQQVLAVNSVDQVTNLTQAQLQQLLNTSLLDSMGLKYRIAQNQVKVNAQDERLTGNLQLQLESVANPVEIDIPIDASFMVVRNNHDEANSASQAVASSVTESQTPASSADVSGMTSASASPVVPATPISSVAPVASSAVESSATSTIPASDSTQANSNSASQAVASSAIESQTPTSSVDVSGMTSASASPVVPATPISSVAPVASSAVESSATSTIPASDSTQANSNSASQAVASNATESQTPASSADVSGMTSASASPVVPATPISSVGPVASSAVESSATSTIPASDSTQANSNSASQAVASNATESQVPASSADVSGMTSASASPVVPATPISSVGPVASSTVESSDAISKVISSTDASVQEITASHSEIIPDLNTDTSSKIDALNEKLTSTTSLIDPLTINNKLSKIVSDTDLTSDKPIESNTIKKTSTDLLTSKLPQTGNDKDEELVILGMLGIASAIGSSRLSKRRKKA